MEQNYKRLNYIDLHRVSVRVKWEGRIYKIFEQVLDDYGQPIRDVEGNYVLKETGQIKALYSTSHSYVQKQSSEQAVTVSKQNPMLFCDYREAQNLKINLNTIIKSEDENYTYKVTDLTDIYLLGTVGQISLEVYNGL